MLESLESPLFQEAVLYASENISRMTKYKDFAIALIDRFGLDVCPFCRSLFSAFCFWPGFENFHFDDAGVTASREDLLNWHKAYQEEQRKKQEETEIKKGIDELVMLVKRYRDSHEFKRMLDFVGRFPYFAPYNAMLLYLQKPGATFVLTAKQWKAYNRQIKPNAQNIIMLIPFGPTYCLHDISDTEQIPGQPELDDVRIMQEWENSLNKPSGEIDRDSIELLKRNLAVYGILLDDKFKASQSYGGYIGPHKTGVIEVPLNKKHSVKALSSFLISINEAETETAKFHTLCHELGHLFCRHLYYDKDKIRHLSIKEEEFEAETVAWLLCKRHNISNPSEEYLATYASDGEIPYCSPDAIMNAVAAIERMMTEEINIKESPWYKLNPEVKLLIDRELARIKSDKHGQMNLFGEEMN